MFSNSYSHKQLISIYNQLLFRSCVTQMRTKPAKCGRGKLVSRIGAGAHYCGIMEQVPQDSRDG